MTLTRREFVVTTIVGAAACARPLVMPSRKADMRFGYAAITWGTNELLAISQISEAGFAGIQLRASIVNPFIRNPPTLAALLAEKHLSFVALSSGAVTLESADQARMMADHVTRARFLKAVGGQYLQVTDTRPEGRDVTAADCEALGSLLTDLGKRTADAGVTLVYHPHMGTIGETPQNAERVLAACDPKLVRLLLDVAHYKQGGGDPAAAIRRYRERLALVHLKDVQAIPNGYQFVELGKGTVNLDAVFAALDDIDYRGWAIVELDGVPTPDRTAKESAEINALYLRARGFNPSRA